MLWRPEHQLKCQALKQTNTDNKEGDNVLKLGSRVSPLIWSFQDSYCLFNKYLLTTGTPGNKRCPADRSLEARGQNISCYIILSMEAASFSFTALRNINPSRGQKDKCYCPTAKNREMKQSQRAGFENQDGEFSMHRTPV